MKRRVRNLWWLIMILAIMVLAACGNNSESNSNNMNSQQSENIENNESIKSSEGTEAPETTETSKVTITEAEIKELCKDEEAPVLESKYADYIEGYTAYLALVEVKGDTMLIASAGYNTDEKDSYVLREVKIAEDVTHYELNIEKVISDEDEKVTDTYTELTKADMEAILEDTLGIGFVWFNEDMEIEKVLLYGELIIWE